MGPGIDCGFARRAGLNHLRPQNLKPLDTTLDESIGSAGVQKCRVKSAAFKVPR